MKSLRALVLAVLLLLGLDYAWRARGIDSVGLSWGDSFDDFPSLAVASDDQVYVGYTAYTGRADEIRIHRRLPSGRFSAQSRVPLATARPDVWMPRLVTDGGGRLWVFWSEQLEAEQGRPGNWDVFGRWFDGRQWGPLERLSIDPAPDVNLDAVADARGRIHLVWQTHRGGSGDVVYRRHDGGAWSRPRMITDDGHGDWFPRVAVDGDNQPWVVWDSYRNGSYDVYLARPEDRKATPVAAGPEFQGNAALAFSGDDLWLTWEEGTRHWGLDRGQWLQRARRRQGGALGPRRVRTAVMRDGRLLRGPDLPDPAGTCQPGLATDEQGQVWLYYRRRMTSGGSWRTRASRLLGRRHDRGQYWRQEVAQLRSAGWSRPRFVAGSAGRMSTFSDGVTTAGSLIVAFATDGREEPWWSVPVQDEVRVATLRGGGGPGSVALGEALQPELEAEPGRAELPVRPIRADEHRVEVEGRELVLLRGDLHRHTELGRDSGPSEDGSLLDAYRYFRDVAALDFGAVTDQGAGGQPAYYRWLTEKAADLFLVPDRFTPFPAYERAVRSPEGHRNILLPRRGLPLFATRTMLDERGPQGFVGAGWPLADDTSALHEALARVGGIAIPHSPADTRMGTDWTSADPRWDPVVEIYQGARYSAEYSGAPRTAQEGLGHEPGVGEYEPSGTYRAALQAGHRLGVIASSDHGSTHISYAMVYAAGRDREAILDAMRARRTYAATDDILLELWARDVFMGGTVQGEGPVELTLVVEGTDRVERVVWHRDGIVVDVQPLHERRGQSRFRAERPGAYYARVEQKDGELAWSSPIWVEISR